LARQTNVKDLAPILDAAASWIAECLIEDGSVFSSQSVWTSQIISEARSAFVLNPDFGENDFITKLQGQIAGTSVLAQQLMAEMLWALLLFPSGSRPITKRAQLTRILSGSNSSLPLNSKSLSDAVLSGIGSGGPAFNTYRPSELEYLLDLVLDLKNRPKAARLEVFGSYDKFIEWIGAVGRKGDRQYRHMLRYFAFPDLVERISTNADRRLILEGFGQDQIKTTKSWSDAQLDQALLKLRQKQQEQYPSTVLDFYEPPLRQFWAADRKSVVVPSGTVPIVVPTSEDDVEEMSLAGAADVEPRPSHQMQAAIAEIGALMGLKVWLPPGDRAKVAGLMDDACQKALLDKLPINTDSNTLGTVSQIDVLWLNRTSIVRAFEVEHTTAVYSGLLRMADLLALQPNMSIALHIVAPEERKDKVFREMLRPVFTYLEAGPLCKTCTFISYDSIQEIRKLKTLAHTQASIIEDYEERAESELQ